MTDPAVEPAPSAENYPTPKTLGDLLEFQQRTRPNSPALRIPDGEAYTWGRFAELVGGVQSGLAASGVQAGDKVAVMCDNSARAAAIITAVIACGAVCVPVNTAMVGSGLAFVLEHSESKLLVVDPPYAVRCLELGVAGLRVVSTADESHECASWHEMFTNSAPLVNLSNDRDIAQILYTSGTTGEPKGVVLGHGAVLTGAWTSAAIMFEAGPDDVIYTCLPLFHCAAQQLGLWTSMWSGAELVLASKFSVSRFWADIRRFGVTAFHFIGPLLSILWQQPATPRDRDHSATRAVGGGPRVAWREFEERFGVSAVECYGMTESFGGCVTHRPRRGRLGTVGKPADHMQVAVVDETGNVLPVGGRGEIVIRGKHDNVLFTEYFKRPDLTAAARACGWYHTGDLGSFDDDGFLTFHSRLKEVLRHRGENVSVLEVEAVLTEHPQVADCAVVGVPSPLGEDDILAVVVPADEDVDIPALLEFAAAELPSFAIPRYVSVQSSLPRTATHRLQRHLLKGLQTEAFDREGVRS